MPSTSKPSIGQPAPGKKKPTVGKPPATSQEPVVKKPAIQTPAAQTQAVQKPAVQKPPARKPSVKKPPIQEAVVQKPAIQSPAFQIPDVEEDEEVTHFSDRLTTALGEIKGVIEDNKGVLDSIQEMALELTRVTLALRVVVIKYVEKADKFLDSVVPLMEKFPLLPDSLVEFAKDAQSWSQKILDASDMAARVLPDVERSLKTADIEGLNATKGNVTNLTRTLKGMIPKGEEIID